MKRIILLVTIFLLYSQSSNAQWKKVDLGLNVSGIGPIMKLSDRIITGGYYKLDNDTSWMKMSGYNYIVKNKLWHITKAKGDTIVAFPYTIQNEKNSLFISTDKGLTWAIQESTHPDNPRPTDVSIDADTIYVVGTPTENTGTSNNRIYSTSDLGKTYRSYQNPRISFNFNYIEKIGDHLFVARQPIPSHPNDTSYVGVVRTNDGGENWETVNNGLNPYITFLRRKDTVLYAGTHSGLFASNNFGDEWSMVPGLPSSYAQFFDYEDEVLTVCLNNQIYLSSDNGTNWNSISDEFFLELNTSINGLSIRKGVIYVSTARGLYSTGDAGLHWKVERFEGANPSINTVESYASKLYVGTQNFGIYQSGDKGASWMRIDSNFSGAFMAPPSVSVLHVIDSSLYASPFISNSLYTANLNTLQWKSVNVFNTPGWINSIIKFKDILVMSHSNGLFYSKDGGENWLQSKVDNFSGSSLKGMIHSDTLFIPTQNGIIYSTDGLKWNLLHSFPWFEVVNFWKNSSIEIITVSDRSQKSTTFYSWITRDRGATWDTLDFVANAVLFNGTEILATVRGKGLAALSNGKGIAISKDEGRTWTFKNEGIDELDISRMYSFVVAGDTIFAYGASGIYKDALLNYITTSVKEEQEFVQNYFYSYPPYPLPTSDKVNVSIYWGPDVELKVESIEIFSVFGEKVSRSQDITISKHTEGNGLIQWNCRSIPPGAYVMKVCHGNATSAIKIMLAR